MSIAVYFRDERAIQLNPSEGIPLVSRVLEQGEVFARVDEYPDKAITSILCSDLNSLGARLDLSPAERFGYPHRIKYALCSAQAGANGFGITTEIPPEDEQFTLLDIIEQAAMDSS